MSLTQAKVDEYRINWLAEYYRRIFLQSENRRLRKQVARLERTIAASGTASDAQ